MNKINIAIDGWSSCGKSTMARQLAKLLDYTFIDSGAMYRAITLFFLQNNIDTANIQAVQLALNDIHLRFQKNNETGNQEICLNGLPVEMDIRSMAVAEKVSEVAAIKAVRDFAVAQQQLLGIEKGVVMDGRDIGTVVFPDAELKIFMTASIEVRTKRRLLELQSKDPYISLEKVAENLKQRDLIDSTREVSPLKKADDALILDNTFITPEEQLKIALDWTSKRIEEANQLK
jgi:cytidylate kinase